VAWSVLAPAEVKDGEGGETQAAASVVLIRSSAQEPRLAALNRLRAALGGKLQWLAQDTPMALDLNDPELEFSDLVYAYQSWVMAVINDEKLGGEEKLLTDDITEDALNAMRFLPGEVTSAIETSLARVYDVDPDELADLLFPGDD
jgi:hypothetical protein